MATRIELEIEKSLRREQQYGAWKRELTENHLPPGEPRAAISEQDASQASEQHIRAKRVPGYGPMHERWGFDAGPGVRPSRKDRGMR